MTVPHTRSQQSGRQYPGSSKLRLVPAGQRKPTRRWPRWAIGLSLGVLLAVASVFAWAILARKFAATCNTGRTHFDAILVLGSKADADGNPTPEMLARVNEAVREYEHGVAPRLIVSGAAAHNQYVEAKVMARAAEAEGIPASSILIEDQAQDTIQNVCYSTRILKTHGWNSAEVISTAPHLPRTAMILGNFPLEWRTHAAPLLSPDPAGGTLVREGIETFKTVRYLLAARPTGGCEP